MRVKKGLLRHRAIAAALSLHHKLLWRKSPIVEVLGKRFLILPSVFSPVGTLTSTLLAKNLGVKQGDYVLDVGTGCGIQAVFAAEKAEKVVATDINPIACLCAKLNAALNGVESRVDILAGDLLKPLGDEKKFALAIFSPPYLIGEPKSFAEMGWLCGSDCSVLDEFFGEVWRFLRCGGRVRMVYSTIADIDALISAVRKHGFRWRLVEAKSYPQETIFVLEAVRS